MEKSQKTSICQLTYENIVHYHHIFQNILKIKQNSFENMEKNSKNITISVIF